MKKTEDKDKPLERSRPSSYPPNKAELDEDIRITATHFVLMRTALAEVWIDVSRLE